MEQVSKFKMVLMLAALCDLAAAGYSHAQDDGVARYWSSSRTSSRTIYEEKLIKEVLEKSKVKYGDYQLQIIYDLMTAERGYREVKRGELINFQTNPLTRNLDEEDDDIRVLPYELMKGILGYRRCIARSDRLARFEGIKTRQDLQQIEIGQVTGWADINIYKANGFDVFEGPDLHAMFQMLSRGRFDCFPLGISEVEEELAEFTGRYPNLVIVPDLVLYYPLPVRLQVRKESTQLSERLVFGLDQMIADGSFDKLFNASFGGIVKQITSPNTRLIALSNPFLPDEQQNLRPELIQRKR